MNLRKNKLFKFTFIFFITTLISSPLVAQEVIDRVVAIVNDDLITLSELRETTLSVNPASTEQLDERTVLNQMVESKLFEQEAKKKGITVTKEELDASIEQVMNKYNMNEEQMVEVLKKQNLTPESFREQWRVQTLGNKLLESQLKNKIVVTDAEIEAYYKENYGTIEYSGNSSGITEQTGEEVEVAHILISPDTPNAQDRAVEVAELAKSGNDFGRLAREYSDDSFTADKGGLLGSFKKGDLIEPLEVAVERTPEGKVSGPVQSPAGYHIIKVLNRTKPNSGRGKAEKSEDETYISDSDREEIRQILHRGKAELQLKTWIQGVREQAYVEIKL